MFQGEVFESIENSSIRDNMELRIDYGEYEKYRTDSKMKSISWKNASNVQEFSGWDVISNYEYAELGRLWVFWRSSVVLKVLSKSSQDISCLIKINNQQSLVVSFIYAANCRFTRIELWDGLNSMATRIKSSGAAWAVMGEFNQTLSPNESSTGSSRIPLGMQEFRDCLHNTELSDLCFQGPTFTWWNNQDGNPLAKKLDRILVNDEWRMKYPHSYGIFGPMEFSDHTTGLLCFGSNQQTRKTFKVANHVLSHPNFLDMVSHFWESIHLAGTAMFTFIQKLKLLKRVIKTFNSHHFSDLELRVNEAREALNWSQEAFIRDPSVVNAKTQKEHQARWWLLATAEDKFLRQRARIRWLNSGDKNTAYFHKVVQARRAVNRIHYLTHHGSRLSGKEEMEQHCVSYFSTLMGADSPQPNSADLARISHHTRFRCPESLKAILQTVATEEEIRNEVFALPLNKSPGPDGYNAEFFINCWPVIGDDFIRAIKEFFRHGEMLRQWNATSITLIPKLQLALPEIISSNQSAFVKGRLLVENVTLATELVKGFGTNTTYTRGALKVDLTKAFDTVRWEFIIAILQAADFPECFIGWVRECITTTSFSICLNGELCGFFDGKRGLRQGDPLSPSLFILAMEVFSHILKTSFNEGNIGYHGLCRDPAITHLSFADDVLIFFDGKPQSLEGITNVFNVFGNLSGLRMNMAKTTLFSTGLSSAEEGEIQAQGYSIGQLPIRYLGLPLLARRMRKSDYSPLLESIRRRFTSWTVRSLSFAGRLQLINSVIYSTINFWMGAFLLPKGCLREITKMCMNFFWAGSLTTKSKPKVSWKLLCLPKSEGGLGLRDLKTWNMVMSLRLIWLLFTKEGSLWVAWIKTHWMKRNTFWNALGPSSSSWIWRSLLQLRPLAKRFLTCKLGDGLKASFWYDSWTPVGPLIDIMGEEGPSRLGITINCNVAAATIGGQWRLPAQRTRCPTAVELRDILLQTRPPNSANGEDQFLWGDGANRSKCFSTTRTWEALRNRGQVKTWAKLIWHKITIPKHAFLSWVITLDRLPLSSRLHKWGVIDEDICCVCKRDSEDRDHLFLTCQFAMQIWDWLQRKLYTTCAFTSWDSLLTWLGSAPSKQKTVLRILSTQALFYAIWRERNNRLHNSVSGTTNSIIAIVDKSVRQTLLSTIGRRGCETLLSQWFAYF